MAATIKNFVNRIKTKPEDEGKLENTFQTAPEGQLFPKTDPVVDGEDCTHDCLSCTIEYPKKFSIDETEKLYGHINGWQTHLVVATGKTDWVRDVKDEKGSIMEAVDASSVKPSNGKLMLSASNMPVSHDHKDGTTVLLLPSFIFIDQVTPANTPDLISTYVNGGSTNTTPLDASLAGVSPPSGPLPGSGLTSRPCPHRYLILFCSQKTRDARCGQSAPLLRKEFERILRPLGLYRDLHDERPGGVGMYFISHVGGHKFSANVMVYRRGDAAVTAAPPPPPSSSNVEAAGQGSVEAEKTNGDTVAATTTTAPGLGEASQCIWLARVRPEDCENIVRYTVLQGKVVKPESQLRGGFDREKGLTSW